MPRNRTAALFLFFWAAIGATTNVQNMRAYNLQQMGVDAIVAHRTFSLGHSALSILQPQGDTFVYDGRILAAKQPGQFLFGAVPYVFLHAAGITYERDYDLAASLVTWLSAGLFGAAALALLDRMLDRLLGFGSLAALLATASVGLGSYWFCYAGVAHHDILAGSLILAALFAVESNRARFSGGDWRLSLAAGALLGLALFTSMLPALLVAALCVYVLATLPYRASLWHAAGFVLGLLPLLAYNARYLGSPLVPANIAGNYSDTFFSLEAGMAAHHLNAYLGWGALSIWKYAPALGAGIAGLFLLPPRLRYLLAGSLIVHVLYLIHIPTLGGCQFGPRYLLPVLPLLAIGLAALLRSRVAMAVAGALLAYGMAISLVGALQGTMYCGIEDFAPWQQAQEMDLLAASQFPLRALALVLPVAAVWFWKSSGLGLAENWRTVQPHNHVIQTRDSAARPRQTGS